MTFDRLFDLELFLFGLAVSALIGALVKDSLATARRRRRNA